MSHYDSKKRSASTSPSITVTLQRDADDSDEDESGGNDRDGPIEWFSAKIRRGGEVVGGAILIIVHREEQSCYNFHSVCDEHSGELEAVATFLCDREGKAHRHLSIGDHDGGEGFLYIQSLYFHSKHRAGSDFDFTLQGAEAVRAILRHPLLRNRSGYCSWDIAVYQPDSRAQMTEAEARRINQNDESSENETRQIQQEKLDLIKRCCKKDARQFLRAGFKQVTPPSLNRGDYYHLFATPDFVSDNRNLLSHQEAVSVLIVDAPDRPLPPTGKDLEIRETVQREMMMGVSSRMAGHSPPPRNLAGFESHIQNMVREGGSIENSFVIHECVDHGKLDVMNVLLRVAGGMAFRAINAKDEDGLTPLMKAATAAAMNYLNPNPYAQNAPSPVGMCDKIIAKGADKSVTDSTGLTALGHMRKQMVSSMSYLPGRNRMASQHRLEPLANLLMPPSGPTPADNAALTETQAKSFSYDDDDGDY